MKIFTPIAASLVLVCVATQGDLIAQNRRDSDLRQQIRRIVREELKRALAEVHESQGQVAPKKKARTKKAPAKKVSRKRVTGKKRVRQRVRSVTVPPAASALDQASKALAAARRALAEAERALKRARGAGLSLPPVRALRRDKTGVYRVELKTRPRKSRTIAPTFRVPKIPVPVIRVPKIQIPRFQAPKFNFRVIAPETGVRTYVFDGGKGKTYKVERAPIKAKKKGMKGNQRKKKPRKAKKRSGRIV